MDTTITTWATFIAALTAIIALILESRRFRLSIKIDNVIKFDERFNSLEMLKKRKTAAKLLKEGNFTDVEDVLDFFEMVGMLARRGLLDKTMVWATFSYWIIHYYHLTKEYIKIRQKASSTLWNYFEELFSLVSKVELKEQKIRINKIPTKKELDDFIKEESTLVIE